MAEEETSVAGVENTAGQTNKRYGNSGSVQALQISVHQDSAFSGSQVFLLNLQTLHHTHVTGAISVCVCVCEKAFLSSGSICW